MAENSNTPSPAEMVTTVGHPRILPQTGSWNMADFLSRPLNLTVGVLQKYSASQVDPYTVLVGQAICAKFRLRAAGRQRLEDALSSLSGVGSLGNVVFFGFGADDVIRSLVKTEEGAVCVALCAALRECYHENIAVEVLLELARLTSVPGSYMPSSFQWKGLLNACSGALATTTFSLLAEKFMALLRPDQCWVVSRIFSVLDKSLFSNENGRGSIHNNQRCCSTPESIAQALFAMARVTTDELKTITIVGGEDAGWLAALGQWLFDCKIELRHGDETVIYRNFEHESHIQLEFISYPATTGTNGRHPRPQQIEIRDRTYVLNNVSDLINMDLEESAVSGRIPWERVLSSAFPIHFRLLVQNPRAVGHIIGSAARIFQAIADSDEGFRHVPINCREACTTSCPESYGTGLVQNTLSWFPELAVSGVHMEIGVAMKPGEALRAYEVERREIQRTCACFRCERSFDFEGYAPVDNSELFSDFDGTDDTDIWGDRNVGPCKMCLVVLVETIICLSRSLAHMKVAKNLYPTRQGFEWAYHDQWPIRPHKRAAQAIGAVALCLQAEATYELGAPRWLRKALLLFSGERPSITSLNDISAGSTNGICAFLENLRDFSVRKNRAKIIDVLPGRISFDGKPYSAISDDNYQKYTGRPTYDLFDQNDFSSMIDSSLKLRVKEASNSLRCLIQIPRNGPNQMALLLGPVDLYRRLTIKRYIRCNQKGTCKTFEGRGYNGIGDPISHLDGTGDSSQPYNIMHVKSFDAKSKVQVIAVLAAVAAMRYNSTLFVIGGECQHCCARAAIELRSRPAHFICFLRICF